MKIKVAESAGYCYGVERAMKLAHQAKKEFGTRIFTLGPLIHNPQAVEELRSHGIMAIEAYDDLKAGDVLVIRSHGVDPAVIKKLNERGVRVIDATCPFVKKAQKKAEELVASDYRVVIIGEPNHPEVAGIMAYAKNKAVVVQDKSDIKKLSGKIGVVVQTTQSLETLKSIASELLGQANELNVHNTICDATIKRQENAHELAGNVDVMIVVGGYNSANTARLAKICEQTGTRTHHIETPEEIRDEWFDNCSSVGITAGASTPDRFLNSVVKHISELTEKD